MKKLIVIGIVAAMVMGLAVAASAALDDTWMMQLRPYAGGVSAGTVTLGTKPGASDSYTTVGGEDGVLTPPIGTPGELISLIVPGQRTSKDVRAPLTVGQTKIWDLSLYIVGGGSGTIKLDGWMAGTTNMLSHSTGGDPDIKLELKKGSEVLWTVPYDVSGSQSAPTFTTNIAFSGQPISLQLVASAMPAEIPEPGSMVAVLSGLVGLVGFGIRRRK